MKTITKETEQVKVFREFFGEDISEVIKEVFEKVDRNMLLGSDDELPLYPLSDMYDILEDGDYLVDIEACIYASGIFGETGRSMKDAVIKVNKPNSKDNYPEHCGAFIYNSRFDTSTDIADLNFSDWLVVPKPRDLLKAKEELEENKQRLEKIEQQIELLIVERHKLYKKLS